jgi:hypothetical protein
MSQTVKNRGPLLFAVLVFEGLCWKVTPANSEGRLYITYEKAAIKC